MQPNSQDFSPVISSTVTALEGLTYGILLPQLVLLNAENQDRIEKIVEDLIRGIELSFGPGRKRRRICCTATKLLMAEAHYKIKSESYLRISSEHYRQIYQYQMLVQHLSRELVLLKQQQQQQQQQLMMKSADCSLPVESKVGGEDNNTDCHIPKKRCTSLTSS